MYLGQHWAASLLELLKYELPQRGTLICQRIKSMRHHFGNPLKKRMVWGPQSAWWWGDASHLLGRGLPFVRSVMQFGK